MNQIVRAFGPLGGHAPPYEHQEYPKWVGDVIVQDEAEERALLAKDAPDVADEPEIDRDALVKFAEDKGVKIDKRWSVAKITAAIEAAGVDLTEE